MKSILISILKSLGIDVVTNVLINLTVNYLNEVNIEKEVSKEEESKLIKVAYYLKTISDISIQLNKFISKRINKTPINQDEFIEIKNLIKNKINENHSEKIIETKIFLKKF